MKLIPLLLLAAAAVAAQPPTPPVPDKQGVSHYSTDKRRGSLLRFGADGKVEPLAPRAI